MTSTTLKIQNLEKGVAMIQYLWCSKIKMKTMKNTHLVPLSKTSKKTKRSVETVVECQKILPFRKFSRADIANDFIPGSYNVPENIRKIRLEEYNAWCISRHVKPTFSNSEIKNSIIYWNKKFTVHRKGNINNVCFYTDFTLPHHTV